MTLDELKLGLNEQDATDLTLLKLAYEDVYVLGHENFDSLGEIEIRLSSNCGEQILDEFHKTSEISRILNFKKEDTKNG